MKLTRLQKTTRFIVYSLRNLLLLSLISGILPATIAGQIYQIFSL